MRKLYQKIDINKLIFLLFSYLKANYPGLQLTPNGPIPDVCCFAEKGVIS